MCDVRFDQKMLRAASVTVDDINQTETGVSGG